jgi:hypothetical protein
MSRSLTLALLRNQATVLAENDLLEHATQCIANPIITQLDTHPLALRTRPFNRAKKNQRARETAIGKNFNAQPATSERCLRFRAIPLHKIGTDARAQWLRQHELRAEELPHHLHEEIDLVLETLEFVLSGVVFFICASANTGADTGRFFNGGEITQQMFIGAIDGEHARGRGQHRNPLPVQRQLVFIAKTCAECAGW